MKTCETQTPEPVLCTTRGHWHYAIKDADKIAASIVADPNATARERQLASCIAALVRAAYQIPCAI